MKRLFVILPCYNEGQDIGELLEEWEKQEKRLQENKLKLEIRVINDASTDNTREVVLQKQKKYNNIKLIEHEENKGLRGGINTALNYFNENASKGDFLLIMDGDNTQNPKYVHSMIEKMKKGNDCVIASRYQEGAKVKGLVAYREKLSDIAKIYYETVLNIKGVKDYTCGYRIYTYDIIHKVVQRFGKEVVKEKSFACMMELLYKIHILDAKIDEVPFELRYDNKKGASKMKVFTTMRRSITTAILLQFKYNWKNVIKNLGTALFLILLPLLLSLVTNYSPTNNQSIGHDCGIFSYIGYAMQNGLAPYTDAWDNKGPLLYLIYYLGFCLSGEFGVYLLEYISILVMTIFGYKTIKLITNSRLFGIIGIIYSLTAWLPTNEAGTLSEEFALPFMAIGMYLFAKCIKNNMNLSKANLIIWGICCAALALLRLNILLVFLPLFIIIAVVLIKQREWKKIATWLLYGIIGFAILVIPIAIYLIINGAFIECINTAYLQVMSGFESGTLLDKINALKKMMLTLNESTQAGLFMLIFSIAGIVLIILKQIKEKNTKLLFIGTILTILINLYANGLSGAVQMHYFTTFIPIIIMMVAVTLYSFKVNMQDKFIRIGGTIIIILALLVSIQNYVNLTQVIVQRNEEQVSKIGETLVNYIVENSNKDDKVQLIGSVTETVTANYQAKRLAATRYSYLPLWGSFTKERRIQMTNEFVESIKKEEPKLIIILLQHQEIFESFIEDKEEWDNFLLTEYNEPTQVTDYFKAYTKK